MDRKEAIEVLKKYKYAPEVQEALETLIPELKEGEDERIRKAIFQALSKHDARDVLLANGLQVSDALAWLEKQGDKAFSVERLFAEAGIKPAYKDGNSWCVLIGENIQEGICGFGETPRHAYVNFLKELWGKAFEQKSADKVETKQNSDIEKGKWYVCDTPRYADFAVGKAYYCPKNGMLKPNENEMARYVAKDCFHLWTIQDAKDGDVLSFNDGHGNDSIELIKSITEKKIEFWFCLTNGNRYEVFDGITPYTNLVSREDAIPATKEQRDLLFQKMREAGYQWDSEKKELVKIEQNSAWSKEDENELRVVISYVNSNPAQDPFYDKGCLKDWLKSLKDRVQPKPKSEWNNDDEISFNRLMAICADERVRISPVFSEKEIKDLMDWFKSIKTRVLPHWKPSDEQMSQLECVAIQNKDNMLGKELMTLFNDLKKLKG